MTATEKPSLRLVATAAAGVCHFCLQVPCYLVTARSRAQQKDFLLRVCRPHLIFLQSSERTPFELRAVDGQSPDGIDLSTAEQYVVRKHAPDIQASALLTAG